MSSQKAWAVIAGVGPGTGACIARKFSKAYSLALLSRSSSTYDPLVKEINEAGGKAIGISADVTDPQSIKDAFAQIKKDAGGAPVVAGVYNAASKFMMKGFLELSLEDFESGFEVGGRGAFLFSQAIIPLLLEAAKSSPEYPPTLIFTSATAALRGSAKFATYAPGKFAQRGLAQSLAREFGPQSLHVAHVVVDGIIDTERTKQWGGNEPDSKLSPAAIADSYWYLHTQPRSCFTHELDLRPFAEKW